MEKSQKQTKFLNSILNYCLLMFSIFIFSYSIYELKKAEEELTYENLFRLKGVTKNDSEIRRMSKGSSSSIIEIEELSDFKLIVIGAALDALNKSEYLSSVKQGDTIEFYVSKEEYEMKVLKTKEVDFFTKYFNYDLLYIYELREKDKILLLLNDFKVEKELERKWYFLFILIAIFLFWRLLKDELK